LAQAIGHFLRPSDPFRGHSALYSPGGRHPPEGNASSAQVFAIYNHSSGFFGRLEAYWARQSNVGYAPDIPATRFFNSTPTPVTDFVVTMATSPRFPGHDRSGLQIKSAQLLQ
jgi:hypothetical protein